MKRIRICSALLSLALLASLLAAPVYAADTAAEKKLSLREDWRLTSDLDLKVPEGKILTIDGEGKYHIYELGGTLKNSGKGAVVFSDGTILYPAADDEDAKNITAEKWDAAASTKLMELRAQPSYTVTVESGITSGSVTASVTSAKAGQTVTLTAVPASGYQFSGWTVTTASGTAVTVTNNSFTMPDSDVTVRAVFAVPAVYQVTVTGGEGGGSYPAGETVTITATVPAGQRFVRWTVEEGDIALADPDSAATTFTMPAHDVAVSAGFRDTSSSSSESGNTGSTGSSAAVSDPATSGGTTSVTTEVKPTTSGTTSSATVSQSSLDKAVDSALNEAQAQDTAPAVEITVDMPSRADTVQVTLPAASLETLGGHEDATLTITSSVGALTLDSTAITSVAGQAGQNITVSVALVPGEELNQHQQETAGEDPVYELTIQSGRRTITDFDGGVITVSLPYDLPEGRDPGGVTAFYLDDQGGAAPCETTYSVRTRMATFVTRHFSKYVVGYVEQETAGETPQETTFADVPAGAWYADAVQYVCENGLMTGTGADTFSPEQPTSRAMIAAILYRQVGSPMVNTSVTFTDVAEGQWYTQAVRWANSAGVVTGYGDGTFGPDEPITREQLAVMLCRFAAFRGYDVSAGGMAVREFADSADISDWALEAMAWAVHTGLLGGREGNVLDPTGTATRAEAAAILMRFCENAAV